MLEHRARLRIVSSLLPPANNYTIETSRDPLRHWKRAAIVLAFVAWGMACFAKGRGWF